jgi:hypothetical protein
MTRVDLLVLISVLNAQIKLAFPDASENALIRLASRSEKES